MKAIGQKVRATVWRQRDARLALLLDEAATPVVVRYALVLVGSEAPVFPAFLLDDWGKEIRALRLYDWVRENGNEFPRAELFGFDANGAATQHFLREFELYLRWPCYVYERADRPVEAGLLLTDVLIPDPAAANLRPAQPPPQTGSPLRRAAVDWQTVNPARLPALGFTRLF